MQDDLDAIRQREAKLKARRTDYRMENDLEAMHQREVELKARRLDDQVDDTMMARALEILRRQQDTNGVSQLQRKLSQAGLEGTAASVAYSTLKPEVNGILVLRSHEGLLRHLFPETLPICSP